MVAYFAIFTVLYVVRINHIPVLFRSSPAYFSEGGGTWITFRKFDRGRKWDVIVMGSSHAYRGYDPAIFEKYGLSAYTLGTSAQPIMCSYRIAKNYLNRRNCGIVILDVYESVFSGSMMESTLDLIQNIDDDRTATDLALSSADMRAINALVHRFYNKNRQLLNPDTSGHYNGYYSSKRKLVPRDIKPERKFRRYTTNTEQLAYLDKLLAYLASEGIRTVVVEHPLPTPYMVTGHEQFVRDLKPILMKYRVPFYDYTGAWGPEALPFFMDDNHLNIYGVQRFNEMLIRDLRRDQILP